MRETTLKLRVFNWAASFLMLAAVLTALFDTKPAFAQAGGAGVLMGNVTDAQSKQALTDVVVTATAPELQGEQVVVTDNSGFYRIPDLPAGTYTIRLEKDGYKPYAREGIVLHGGATLRVNSELLPSTVTAEEVVVVAKPPTVDVGSSSVGSTITQDFTSRVSVAPPSAKGTGNRSIEAVSEVTPGAKSDQYGVSFAGTSSPENSYIVDGMNVGSPGQGLIGTALSSEFVQEVNVITGGYMPEYGRTMGGMINAITKSGSNEFHGGVFSYFTPGALAGTPKAVTAVGGTIVATTPIQNIYDIGADVGGPIQKDKLWFYVGFDYASTAYDVKRDFYHGTVDPLNSGNCRYNPMTNMCNATVAGYPNSFPGLQVDPQGNPIMTFAGSDKTYTASAQALQAIGKLTYAINPDNKLTATFILAPTTTGSPTTFAVDPRSGQPDVSGFDGTFPSIARQLSTQAYDGSLKWSTEFANKRVLVDTIASWHHEEDDFLPSDGTLPGSGQGLAAVPNVQWGQNSNPTTGLPYYHGIGEFETGNSALVAACRSPNAGMPFGMMVGQGYTFTPVNTLCPVQTYSSGGPPNQLAIQKFDRYQFGSTATYLLQAAGHHVIKAGFNVEYTTFDDLKDHAGGWNYLESADGTYVTDNEGFGVLRGPDNPSLGPLKIKSSSLIAGGFLQDSWSIMDVITANVGVRYDVQELYGANGQLGLSLPNEWSPRIGLIYDPTQEGHAKIFANYARYYENVPISLADSSLTGEPSTLSVHPSGTSANACDVTKPPYCQNAAGRQVGNGTFNPPQDPSQVWRGFGFGRDPIDPNVQPTSTDDFVAGGEYEIIKDSRLGVSYQRRWINRWIEDMSRDNLNTFFIGNPGYGIASDFPQAERVYDAVTLYFMKAFADNWLASASYTISYLRGNIGGLYKTSNNELDPNRNADFDLKAFTINTYGPLDGDHTHDIKLFGAKDWVINPQNRISTGLSLRAQSGAPINYYASDVNYGQTINLLLPRGSGGRQPWIYDVDANLGYRFSIDKDKSITLTMDIFNLLNFQEEETVDPNWTLSNALGKTGACSSSASASTCNTTLNDARVINSDGSTRPLYSNDKNPNWGHATSYQPPRYFRFGIRGTF